MLAFVPDGAIARFPVLWRERVRRCAAISPNMGQLAHTFPLLLHSLALEYGPREARLAAVEMVEAGRPLGEVAAAVGLPTCLRWVPPEACRDRLPWTRFSPDFSRLLASHIPSLAVMPTWLAAVFFAAHVCNEPFAIWVAKQRLLAECSAFNPRSVFPLALYAWHSQQRESPLRRLAFVPWSARISYKTAVTEAKHWLNRVKLLVYFENRPITDTWLNGANVGGFDFVPLTTVDDILAERLALRNCVDAFGEKLAFNRSRLFGIRCLGERVALLEIVPGAGKSPLINQLKGPQNTEVAREVRQAATVWLRRQLPRRIMDADTMPSIEPDARLHELLQPYWRDLVSRGRPLDVSRPVVGLDDLEDSLITLAAIGGISGWPFSRRA